MKYHVVSPEPLIRSTRLAELGKLKDWSQGMWKGEQWLMNPGMDTGAKPGTYIGPWVKERGNELYVYMRRPYKEPYKLEAWL